MATSKRRGAHSSVSSKSKSKSLRLPNEDWTELEYAAGLHGWGVNDEIKDRIHKLAVEVPVELADGQTVMDFGDDCVAAGADE